MANRPAPALVLRPGEFEDLRRCARSDDAELARRARIVLLAHDGIANAHIAERLQVALPTVRLWRRRYEESGLRGLEDRQRLRSRTPSTRIADATRG